MMNITGARQMKISAVGLVRFELSLQTLLKVIEGELSKFQVKSNISVR